MAQEAHGETTATTLADGSAPHAGEDHGPTLLGLSAEGWVYVGVSIFFLIAVFVFKAHRTLLSGLDARISEAKRTLDEAAAVRAEAEAMLANAKTQTDASAGNAAAIVASAQSEAANILTKAQADAINLVARRTRMAEDRIGAAERTAIAEVRARAAQVSASSAMQLIANDHDAHADKPLIDAAIASL